MVIGTAKFIYISGLKPPSVTAQGASHTISLDIETQQHLSSDLISDLGFPLSLQYVEVQREIWFLNSEIVSLPPPPTPVGSCGAAY